MKDKRSIYYVKASELPSRGMFYPKDITIWITPLSANDNLDVWKHATEKIDIQTMRNTMVDIMREHIKISSLKYGDMDFYDIVEPDQIALLVHMRRASGLGEILIQTEDESIIPLEPKDMRTINLEAPLFKEYDNDGLYFKRWCDIDRCIPFFIPTIGIGKLWCNIAVKYADSFNVPTVATNIISLITVTSEDWRTFSSYDVPEMLHYVETYNNRLNNESKQFRKLMYDTAVDIRDMIGFSVMHKGITQHFDFVTPFPDFLTK